MTVHNAVGCRGERREESRDARRADRFVPIVGRVRADKAVQSLVDPRREAESVQVMSGGEHLTAWEGKVLGVLVAALGKDGHLVDRFDKVHYLWSGCGARWSSGCWSESRRQVGKPAESPTAVS